MKPKENFYSIGRTFNIAPKDIATYNNLQFENGLNVGQVVKIPLTEFNFVQSTAVAPDEALVPLLHTIDPQETLFRLSANFNKVPINSLKIWNHLHSDDVAIGTPLIVGFLKVNKNQSYLAGDQTDAKDQTAKVVEPEEKVDTQKAEVSSATTPALENPLVDKTDSETVTESKLQEPTTVLTQVKTKNNTNFSGGYFKKIFDEQVSNRSVADVSGSAGVFKSTSGWQDGKYYCFNNQASPGSIIKITYSPTGKSVFAKVLDAIPEIRQNEGLSVIVSNSAAEELGATGAPFDCALTFAKN
ncbi:MAG: LysM peptidoglycan-binding domain-containing protein [Ginsengibacter sp.]